MPTSQAGGNIETSSTARLPSSSLRWASITLRMYAASLSPRVSRSDWRIASSSTPSCSMSSGVRWAIGLSVFFCRTVMVSPSVGDGCSECSVVDVAGAGGGEMQVWIGTPPLRTRRRAAVVISPVRRSRTAPSRSGRTQP